MWSLTQPMGSLTPATPRSFHLHQGFDCTRRCPRSRCVKKFFVWRNDICLNDSKCAKTHTHTLKPNKLCLDGIHLHVHYGSVFMQLQMYTVYPSNATNIMRSNWALLHTSLINCKPGPFSSQFPQDIIICPLLRLPTNWHGGLDMFIGLNDLVGP